MIEEERVSELEKRPTENQYLKKSIPAMYSPSATQQAPVSVQISIALFT